MEFLKISFTRVTLLAFHIVLCTGTNDIAELTISPNSFDACAEKTVNITCQLRSALEQPARNNSIGFEICENNSACVQVSVEKLTVINETMTVFEYEIVPLRKRYIRCYYKRVDSTELRTKFALVKFYEMPEIIKTINCTLENYVGSMRCTWSYVKDYQPSSDIAVTWKDFRLSTWDVCKNLSATRDSCYWKSTRKNGDYTMRNISIQISMTDKCMRNTTSVFQINTADNVKPAPVTDLKSMVLNSTCIRLNWKISRARPEYSKRHFINISSKRNITTTNFPTKENEREVSKTFCNLHPYTLYTFSVCMKPTKGGYCSDYRSVRARTFSARPKASPVVTSGAYTWNSKDCGGSKTERNTCLFWKPVKEEDMNGGTVNVSVLFVHEQENVTVEWPGNTSFGCALLSCRKEYTAYIKAKNENGTSVDASVLQIRSSEYEAEKPEFVVEIADTRNDLTTLQIRLLEASGVNKSELTVFWCRKFQGNCNKNSTVQWKTSSDGSHDMVKLKRPGDYLFGVSQNGMGIEWQSCIYTKGKKPTKRVKNVNVEPGHDHSSLVVTWSKQTCDPGESFISHYSVEYCIVNNSPSCQEEIVPANNNPRIVLKELTMEKYAVTVRAISIDQFQGPKSELKTAKPTDKSLPLRIILGAGAVFVAVFIVCFFGIRFRRKIRQFKKESSKIEIPPDLEESRSLESSSSCVDNGYSQQNPPGLEETAETDPCAPHKDTNTLNLNSYFHFDFVTCHSGSLRKQESNMSNFKYEDTDFFLQKLSDIAYHPSGEIAYHPSGEIACHPSGEKALNTNELNKITDEIAKDFPVPIDFKDEVNSMKKLIRDTTYFQSDFSKAKVTPLLQTNDESISAQRFLFPKNTESKALSENISQGSSESTILQETPAQCRLINSNSTKVEGPETKGNIVESVQYTLESPILVDMARKLRAEKESKLGNVSETIPMNNSTEINSSSAEMNFSQLPVPVAFLSSGTVRNY